MTLRKRRLRILRLTFLPIVFVAVFVRPDRWSVFSATAFHVELWGYLFLLAGLMMRIWSIFYIGDRKSKKLVTDGPYSLCRNPLYVGTFLLSIGVGLCFENPMMLLLLLFLFIPIHFWVVLAEESHLEKLFGDAYRDYKKKTRRFWPSFKAYHSSESVQVPVHAIRRIALDTLGVLLVPQIEDLLELLHRQNIIPVLWYFP
ncbi:MAG: isoprenylcysteine carboxylmethyltransferase family protein [Sedimentisphaerales bacterium]|nr:isoprenylcysteine carboxylmethyltransferase family protein [Sedimentisphaerales bacterium]